MPGDASENDVTRRTLLAVERTYLAWWRTGLTALTVALAAARVVPELSNATHRWPYTLIGAAFALLGIGCIGYGERRRRAVDKAIAQGGYAQPDNAMTLVMAVAGVVLGLLIFVLIVIDA